MNAADDVAAGIFEVDRLHRRRFARTPPTPFRGGQIPPRPGRACRRPDKHDVPRRRTVGENLKPLAVLLVDRFGRKFRPARRLKLRVIEVAVHHRREDRAVACKRAAHDDVLPEQSHRRYRKRSRYRDRPHAARRSGLRSWSCRRARQPRPPPRRRARCRVRMWRDGRRRARALHRRACRARRVPPLDRYDSLEVRGLKVRESFRNPSAARLLIVPAECRAAPQFPLACSRPIGEFEHVALFARAMSRVPIARLPVRQSTRTPAWRRPHAVRMRRDGPRSVCARSLRCARKR